MMPLKPPVCSKPERFPRRQALTFAASLKLASGVVVCADRMIYRVNFSSYELKLSGTLGSNFAGIVTGSADDTDVMKSATQGFLNSIGRSPDSIHVDDLQQMLENFLRTKLEGIPDPKLSLVWAFMRDDGDYHVLFSYNTAVRLAEPTEIIGIGDMSLIRYLIDNLYRLNLTLNRGVALASYLVWAAKKYCPMYCGGDTDIWVLTKPTPTSRALWKVIPNPKIRVAEETFEREGKEHLRSLLNSVGDSTDFFT
jgi:hypothetical protein